MPLIKSEIRPNWRDDIPALEFRMFHGRTSMAVLVPPVTIDEVVGMSCIDVHDRLEQFEKHRTKFEKFASAKFDSSGTDDDGRVWLTHADV